MEDLPVLKYDELAQLWQYGHMSELNGSVADDASLEVMLRIEKTMQRLMAMGDDDRHIVWILLKAPRRKSDRYGDADKKGFYWCQLLTAHYKDFHYLQISNPEGWHPFDLRSAAYVSAKRGETPEVDVNLALLKLEQYVNALVDNICTDALAYNTFIAKNLPYGLRDGRIKRSILNSILPEMSMFKDRDKALDVLSRQESSPVWHTERMTLRTYMHVWRIAYDAYRRKGSEVSEPNREKQSDEEVFMDHNSKGRAVEGLDLDSEEDFLRWERSNSSYHCHDVAYARISLQVYRKSKFYHEVDVPEDSWFSSLGYGVAGYSDDMISILGALLYNGIKVYCDDTDRLLRMAQETDYVGIVPDPNKYACDEDMGNEISLPYEYRKEIIEVAEWFPQPQALPA